MIILDVQGFTKRRCIHHLQRAITAFADERDLIDAELQLAPAESATLLQSEEYNHVAL
jgi:hypothetical protein